jgi:hypothetical protein
MAFIGVDSGEIVTKGSLVPVRRVRGSRATCAIEIRQVDPA